MMGQFECNCISSSGPGDTSDNLKRAALVLFQAFAV